MYVQSSTQNVGKHLLGGFISKCKEKLLSDLFRFYPTGEMIDLIFSIPHDLSARILGSWLKLESVVRMDSAYCRRSTRRQFVEMLSWQRFSLSTSTTSKSAFVSWILLREIKISGLIISGDLCTAEIGRVKHTQLRIIELSWLAELDALRIMAMLANYCKDIRVMRVSNCKLDASFRKVLQENKELRELTLRGPRLLESDLEGVWCPKLEHINIRTDSISTASLDALMRISPSVTKLCVNSFNYQGTTAEWRISDGLNLPRLRSFSLHNVQLSDDDTSRFIHLFQSVTNLSLCYKLTDDVVLAIARCCSCLRTVSLRLTDKSKFTLLPVDNSPTDLSLRVLASHHAQSLQEVYLKDMHQLTTSGITSFIQACPNLHTLHVDIRTGASFRLTPSFMEALQNHPRLTAFFIQGDKMLSEEIIEALCAYGDNLQVLGISARCDQDSVVRILDMCTSLRRIIVPYSRQGAVLDLQTAYPNVQIERRNEKFPYNALDCPTYVHEVL